MTYKRFKQLWNALITDNPKLVNRDKSFLSNDSMSEDTKKELIKRMEEAVRKEK